MPKRVAAAELDQVQNTVERCAQGVSLAELHAKLKQDFSRRTLSRRLAELLAAERIQRRGAKSAARYSRRNDDQSATPLPRAGRAAVGFDTPDGEVRIEFSTAARKILTYVSHSPATRTPCGYDRSLLHGYLPNITAYIPDRLRSHLYKLGTPIAAERAGGVLFTIHSNRPFFNGAYSLPTAI